MHRQRSRNRSRWNIPRGTLVSAVGRGSRLVARIELDGSRCRSWLTVLLLVAGCASTASPPPGSSGARTDASAPNAIGTGTPTFLSNPGTSSGPNAVGNVVVPTCTNDCVDFPSAPLIDSTGLTPVPADAAQRFGPPDDFDASVGPCVAEPQISTSPTTAGPLFPANWLRPRFRYIPSQGEDLFEIRLHAAAERNDLVAYTTSTTWALPGDVWKAVASNAVDQPITVTVRGVRTSAPGRPTGTRGTFSIAPVLAEGTMIYWAATSSDVAPTTSKLVGFRVGDEGVVDTLTIPQAQQSGIIAENGSDLRGQYGDAKGVPPGHVECIGCHVSTPDGNAVAFTDHWPWNVVLASVEPDSTGAVPSYLTLGAQRLLNQPWLGMAALTKAHWSPGDRILVTSYAARTINGAATFGFSPSFTQTSDGLAWMDLETAASIPWQSGQPDPLNAAIQASAGTAWGLLKLEGEQRAALTPSFSHDGATVVYTSATTSLDGRIGDNSETDISTVPFANRQGGTVTPLAGASTPGVSEYYPSYSADDTLVAFNRAASTAGKIYYRPDGEIYVLPAGGGTATRLAANDPPACTGERSPGVINSWAKWSPEVVSTNGKSYYWLVFSSARAYPGSFQVPANQYSPSDTRSSQLYMTGIVRDEASGALTTYAAVYLWNQQRTTTNLTPAWDNVNIPPVPVLR